MKAYLVFVITILFSISSFGQMEYWEDLNPSQKSEYLKACKSKHILNYYKGNQVPTDDDKTNKLLDELVTANDSILPLSFYLFNKICSHSDGALSEMVAEYCVKFLLNHPKYTLTYFSKERLSKIKDPVYKTYAMFLGAELYFDLSTYSWKNYHNLRRKLVDASKGDSESEKTFKLFWSQVDQTIKEGIESTKNQEMELKMLPLK